MQPGQVSGALIEMFVGCAGIVLVAVIAVRWFPQFRRGKNITDL